MPLKLNRGQNFKTKEPNVLNAQNPDEDEQDTPAKVEYSKLKLKQ